MASPMPGRQSAREPPGDLLRAGDLRRQGEPGAREARDDDGSRGEAGEQGSRRAWRNGGEGDGGERVGLLHGSAPPDSSRRSLPERRAPLI